MVPFSSALNTCCLLVRRVRTFEIIYDHVHLEKIDTLLLLLLLLLVVVVVVVAAAVLVTLLVTIVFLSENARSVSFLQNVQTGSVLRQAFYSVWYRRLFSPGAKAAWA
jgi:hypothetical protein